MKHYNVGHDERIVNAHLKMALRAGVKNGTLKQAKGTGAAGSFRVGDKKEKAVKKPKAAKKPKAKKPKAAGAKKVKKPKAAKAKKPKVKKPKAAKKPAAAKAKKPKAAKPKKAKPAAKAKKAAKKWTLFWAADWTYSVYRKTVASDVWAAWEECVCVSFCSFCYPGSFIYFV